MSIENQIGRNPWSKWIFSVKEQDEEFFGVSLESFFAFSKTLASEYMTKFISEVKTGYRNEFDQSSLYNMTTAVQTLVSKKIDRGIHILVEEDFQNFQKAMNFNLDRLC